MTRKMSRPLFAIALALGMIAAFSSPGSAALSTADRPVAAAAAPAQEAATVTAAATPAPVATPAPAVAAAPVKPAATASTVKMPRKPIASRAAPRQAFAASSRGGYSGGHPCH